MEKNAWPFPSSHPANQAKKTVHFKDVIRPLVVGMGTTVFPIDHPDTERVSNKKWAWTSAVQKINEDGSFETRNTIYVPAKKENENAPV